VARLASGPTTIPRFLLREHPMPLSWQDRLDDASTEGDVVVVAKDFVAQFSPQEIQSLPGLCRPGKFFEANDITGYAFLLVRDNCEDSAERADLVHKLADFFASASIRLSQVLARRRHDDNLRPSA
jgi:hypothetical protein